MEEWEHALGVRCSFCHLRNDDTKKMDWANDAKPEKEMARKMYKMMNNINKKYFHAKKDSTGIIITTGVNCYTCHRGTSQPEVVEAAKLPRPNRAPAGPPPGKISGTDTPPTPGENKPAEAQQGRNNKKDYNLKGTGFTAIDARLIKRNLYDEQKKVCGQRLNFNRRIGTC